MTERLGLSGGRIPDVDLRAWTLVAGDRSFRWANHLWVAAKITQAQALLGYRVVP